MASLSHVRDHTRQTCHPPCVCRYQLTSSDLTLAAALATLARFARFTGIGAASARGFGMVRLRNTAVPALA